MPASLPIIPAQLPAGFCPSTEQERLNEYAKSTVLLDNSGWSTILYQSTTPTATQRGYLWFNTNFDRIYRWDATQGAWVARHPYDPGTDARLWWTGTLVALVTFDGGDVSALGDSSGAMWVEDTAMAAKFPLGYGTLPSGTAVAIQTTGGADTVTLTTANLPSHQHAVPATTPSGGSAQVPTPYGEIQNPAGTTANIVDDSDNNFVQYFPLSQPIGSNTAATITNPYRAGVWAKRSSRIYYKAT